MIEWVISRVKGDVLHSGRLYLLPQDVDKARMQFVDKPEQVRVLADELFAWARKCSGRAGGHSCGRRRRGRCGRTSCSLLQLCSLGASVGLTGAGRLPCRRRRRKPAAGCWR